MRKELRSSDYGPTNTNPNMVEFQVVTILSTMPILLITTLVLQRLRALDANGNPINNKVYEIMKLWSVGYVDLCLLEGSGRPYIGRGGVGGKEMPRHRSASPFVVHHQIKPTSIGRCRSYLGRQGTFQPICEENRRRTGLLVPEPDQNQ